MSADIKTQAFRVAAPALRPQTRLELVVNQDIFSNRAEVRHSMILDLTPEYVIAAQSDPPILKSMTDQVVEATIVHHDPATSEASRWGWTTRILGLNNEYKLHAEAGSDALPIPVVLLGPPPKTGLQKANVRQAYRLDVTSRHQIGCQISPDLAPVTLIDFSARGLKLSTPGPPAFPLNMSVQYQLTFPEDEQMSRTTISGPGTVVRLEYTPGERKALFGVRFDEMNQSTARTLERVINHYMLAEQRWRNRER